MTRDKSIGVKISNTGWDVGSAGDANLYFSSSWPLLKIHETSTAQPGATIQHGLQYPPLALAWNPTDGLSLCTVTASAVTVPSGSVITTTSRYFIFRLPINVPYQSPVIKAPLRPQGAVKKTFAFKFAKRGKDISSKDMRDYTIHAAARSPLLHAVLYQKLGLIGEGSFSTSQGMKWRPDLPYRPVYFAYYSTDGATFTPCDNLSQTPPKINYDGDGGIVLNAGGDSGYGSIIVLKDPSDFLDRVLVTL